MPTGDFLTRTVTGTINIVGYPSAAVNEVTGLHSGPLRPQIPLPEGVDDLRSRLAAAKPKAKKTASWFRFENAQSDAADLYIYDEITDPFTAEFWGGISASSFGTALQAVKGKTLTVHINSPGGSVYEGIAIYNQLRGHDAPVNVIVEGIAASIASVIAMSGDTVVMAPHSMLMIHDAWGLTMGNAADHEQQAKILNKLSDNIAGVYAERGDSRINWRKKMLEETWIMADEAVAWKLADRIDTAATSASNTFDLSRYANVPECLTCQAEDTDPDRTPTKRDLEDLLRDAGMSNREAKVFVSEGWKVIGIRDESEEPGHVDETETPVGEDSALSTGTVEEAEEMALLRYRLRLQELAIA